MSPLPARRGSATDADLARESAIEAYGVLDRPHDGDLQGVADLVARLCGVPIAQVNLFTTDEQRQLAAHGMDPILIRREEALCGLVLDEPGTVIVPDASADARFQDNPYVSGARAQVRFYASHPLVSSEGVIVGRLCVLDELPRQEAEIATGNLALLAVVAERAMEILELRLRTRQLASSLAQVEGMRAALQASHDRLAAFAGQVSHDLKAPLASLALSLELMDEQLDVDGTAEVDLDDVRWLARKATSGASRMDAVVDDVLAYALVGGTEKHTSVDLRAVVERVLEDLGEDLRGVEVEVGSLPVVRGDRTQLGSLVQNLVANAAKYRSSRRPATISLAAHRTDDAWVVEVADNGRGIAADDVARVFEPLVRADVSVAGSGIGLATCRRIAESHGGEIGLHANASGGTTFWFSLPARPPVPVAG